MKSPVRSALLFAAIGLAIYAGLYAAAERLVYRTGQANPFFRIATLQEDRVDWVVLGASHAMQLDFGGFNARLEEATGRRVLNLGSPGTGPLYNRFVLEAFLRERRAGGVLYVVDSFALRSRAWNEERFADAKLLRRTPFDPALARRLCEYARDEGVDPRAVLDYLSGFSKINNRERFQADAWEGEAQFGRVSRPSKAAVAKRIAYLYPGKAEPEALGRYLDQLAAIVGLARGAGMAVVVVKTPVPPLYREALPDEAAFDAALAARLGALGVAYHDYSATIADARYYFDTDHLNRAGLEKFLEQDLKALLAAGKAP